MNQMTKEFKGPTSTLMIIYHFHNQGRVIKETWLNVINNNLRVLSNPFNIHKGMVYSTLTVILILNFPPRKERTSGFQCTEAHSFEALAPSISCKVTLAPFFLRSMSKGVLTLPVTNQGTSMP